MPKTVDCVRLVGAEGPIATFYVNSGDHETSEKISRALLAEQPLRAALAALADAAQGWAPTVLARQIEAARKALEVARS